MFIIDEMREAKEAKARLAKVNIDSKVNFQTDLCYIHMCKDITTMQPYPGPADQEDGNGAEDEERGGSDGAEENQSRTKSSRL